MTNEPVPYNPREVLLNGHAIGLVTNLVDSVRADMRAMEERITSKLDDRFESHDVLHDVERVEILDFRRRSRERLTDLEKWQVEEVNAEEVAKARRAGQLVVLTGTARVFQLYGRWIVIALAMGFGAVTAALGGLSIRFGP
jgi:hypothetical protein